MKPIPFIGTDPIVIEIYKIRFAQYINNQQKLEDEYKKTTQKFRVNALTT
jgi:hypothetical protein